MNKRYVAIKGTLTTSNTIAHMQIIKTSSRADTCLRAARQEAQKISTQVLGFDCFLYDFEKQELIKVAA